MNDITNNTVVIQGWMVSELKLKGNELLVFAIIHNISQDGESSFYGSLEYLARWCNSTKQGIIKNLNSLVSKDYIHKIESNNGKPNRYSTKFNGAGIKQSLTGIKQSLTVPLNKVECTIKQSLPNNINILNVNNKTNIKDSVTQSKSTSKKNAIITVIEKKCLEYDITDNTVIDKIIEFYTVLLDNKKLVTTQKIESNLAKLAKVSKDTQLRTIQLSLDRGYMNIDPEWLDKSISKTATFYNGNYSSTTEQTGHHTF